MSDFAKEFGVDIDFEQFDFGFSSVSEEEVAASKGQQQQVEQKVTQTAEATVNLEKKLDVLTELIKSRNSEDLEVKKVELHNKYDERMKALEKLTLPLLYNLLKSSDEAYIHWPDRKDMLETQIRKILEVTRPNVETL